MLVAKVVVPDENRRIDEPCDFIFIKFVKTLLKLLIKHSVPTSYNKRRQMREQYLSRKRVADVKLSVLKTENEVTALAETPIHHIVFKQNLTAWDVG